MADWKGKTKGNNDEKVDEEVSQSEKTINQPVITN